MCISYRIVIVSCRIVSLLVSHDDCMTSLCCVFVASHHSSCFPLHLFCVCVCCDIANRMSRDDFKKAKELEELRKTGAAPPELDEDGKMINPHIPQYISQAPWYQQHKKQQHKKQQHDSCACHVHACTRHMPMPMHMYTGISINHVLV